MIIGSAVNALAVVAPKLAGRAAFRMFGYAGARAPLRDSETPIHAAAVVDPLTVNGKKVLTYRWGDGRRPVLLVHGWQSRAARFAALIPRLRAQGYTPISFDAPGNGDSAGRFTNAFEYVQTIKQIQHRYGPFEAIVAHSFGAVCAFLALREGVRAGRLVTISGVADFGPMADGFIRMTGLSPRSKAAMIARMATVFGPGTWHRLSATHRPQEIDVPVLVIHDMGDRVVDPGQAARIAEAYGAQARRLDTAGLGHHRILADPAVLDAALAFLTSPAATPPPEVARTT
jgi:pimeloyl-ACP methyl ester carboxylesterase